MSFSGRLAGRIARRTDPVCRGASVRVARDFVSSYEAGTLYAPNGTQNGV